MFSLLTEAAQTPRTPRHPDLLDRSKSALVVVDMQESLLNVMHGRDALIANVLLLCRAAQTLDIPILLTTQNASRLGPIAPDIVEAAGREASAAIDKLSFSCAGSQEFRAALQAAGRKQVLLCGVETHVCITQTALDLFSDGYAVHVAPDAVGSRTMEKHKLGMERVRDAGIKPCAAEAALYEWMQTAEAPEFRSLLALVK